MSKRARAQAEIDQVLPTTPQEHRRGAVSTESARAIAEATVAAGFPVPAQLVDLVGGPDAAAALEASAPEAGAQTDDAGAAGETSQEA